MSEWFKSVIEKEQTTFIKGYKNKYEIKMPDNCEYAGYKTEIGEGLVDYLDTAFCVLRYPEDYEFTLIKTSDREDGKRYQRPKLSGKEMSELLYNSHLYGLVYYNEYDYRHGVEYDRKGDYRLGVMHSGGKWFIDLDNFDVKRISAKNFELLAQSLSPDESQKRLNDLNDMKAKREKLKNLEWVNSHLTDPSSHFFDRIDDAFSEIDFGRYQKRHYIEEITGDVESLKTTIMEGVTNLAGKIQEKIKIHQQEYERLAKPFEDLRHITQLQKIQNGETKSVKSKGPTEPTKKTDKSGGKG